MIVEINTYRMFIIAFHNVLKKSYLIFILILLVLSPTYPFFDNFSENNNIDDTAYQDKIVDAIKKSVTSNNPVELNIQTDKKNKLGLGIDNFQGSASAFIGIENKTSQSKFSYIYRETQTDDGTHTQLVNNYNFTVTPLNSTSYDTLEIDVDTYVKKQNFEIEKQQNSFDFMDNNEIFAQGGYLDSLQYSGSAVSISEFNITLLNGVDTVSLIGEVWSASWNGTMLTPGTALQSSSFLTSSTSTLANFEFSTIVPITSSNTYTNVTGGYFFFVLRRNDAVADPVGLRRALHSLDGIDDGKTYTNVSASTNTSPANPKDWGANTDYDLTIEYNASIEFNPYDLNTIVAVPTGSAGVLVDTNGNFTDTTTRTVGTSYRVKYDNTKTLGYTTLINVTYTKSLTTKRLADVQYSSSARYNELNWTITYTNLYDPLGSSLFQTILLPSNFTNISVLDGTTLLTSNVDYSVVSGTSNQSLQIIKRTGNYIVHANSTNLLRTSNIQNYVYDNINSQWDNNNTAFMGVLYPTADSGDIVNATINNIAALNLSGGSINSSLRTENGLILGNGSINGYIDMNSSSNIYSFTNSISFSTPLDPNIPIGVYSIQHYWFNGTAGGAIYSQILIKAVTTMELTIPTGDINVLEGDTVNFSLLVHDKSHNDQWASATKNIRWSYDSYISNFTTLSYDGPVSEKYKYSGSINTSKLLNSIQPQSYFLNISFVESDYSDFVGFNINIFYRGSIDIIGPTTIETWNDLVLKVKLINDTDNNTPLNTSGLTINANYANSVVYNPVDADYTVTVNWDPSFVYGVGNQIELNWTHPDFRSIANQNYTLVTYDFSVSDGSVPNIVQDPGLTYQFFEGSSNNILIWNATDSYPNIFSIESNRTGITSTESSGSWTNVTQQSINLDNLIRGTYNFTVIYIDEASNIGKHTIIITVLDNVLPNIDVYGDTVISEFTYGNTITWTNVGDRHPDTYNISQDGSGVVLNQPWVNGSINYNIDYLVKGTYTFVITIYDDSGNSVSDTVTVTVLDLTAPYVSSPSDNSYEMGVIGNTISWTFGDTYPGVYNISRDGTVINATKSWTNGSIQISIDGLSVGTYIYNITVVDASNNVRYDIVVVYVGDTTSADISQPLDIIYSEGSTGNSIDWVIGDINPNNYSIEQNGGLKDQNTWVANGTINISIDGLVKGVYNFTIIVFDNSQNIAMDTVIVTVIDTTSPVIATNPDDVVYAEDVGGNIITWTATDNYPNYYTVYLNDSIYQNSTWSSGQIINIDIDGLFKGVYNFTIIYLDLSNNTNNDIVFVSVIDNTPPLLDINPENSSYEEKILGNYINWTAFDKYYSSYDLYINNILNLSDISWVSGSSIIISLDNLSIGSYNYTIIVSDLSGNSVTDTVIITVIDTIIPVFTTSPSSNIKSFTNSTFMLNWTVFDNNPFSYKIFQNSSTVKTGFWTNTISFTLSNLEVGIYNITLIVYDISSNYRASIVIVIVKDALLIETNTPEFSIIDKLYEGSIEELNTQWLTLSNTTIINGIANFTIYADNIDSQSELNGLKIRSYLISDDNGTYTLSFNYTNLVPGIYHWNIFFNKGGYEPSNLIIVKFEILPHNLLITIDYDDIITQGEEYRISIKVEYDNPQSSLSLNNLISQRVGSVSGLNLTISIDVVTNSGANTKLIYNRVTGENGFAILVVPKETSQDILELKNISIAVIDTVNYNIDTPLTIPVSELPTVLVNNKSNLDLFISLIRDLVNNNLKFIIILVFILILVTVIVSVQIKKKKKKTKIFKQLNIRATDEIEGIFNLNAIVMKSTYTGLQFYERLFEDAMNLDLALLAGITTAITSVLSEIKEEEMGFETMQRSGLSITMYKGSMITMIFVSNSILPDVLKYQIEEAHETFEKKYAEYSDNTQRLSLIPIEDINNLLCTYMKISLKENLIINTGKINKIKNKKSINRHIRNNIRLLIELNDLIQGADLPLTLYSLFEFLKSKELKQDEIFQIISTSYAYGILNSSTN